jgi:hypothetical protein
VIGLYTSYATPIFLRITSGRSRLAPGPFSLGKWYLPIGAVAVAWVAFIVILLCFPASSSVTPGSMSTFWYLTYAPLPHALIYRLLHLNRGLCVLIRLNLMDNVCPKMVHRTGEDDRVNQMCK